jgi:hypothetical protein
MGKALKGKIYNGCIVWVESEGLVGKLTEDRGLGESVMWFAAKVQPKAEQIDYICWKMG